MAEPSYTPPLFITEPQVTKPTPAGDVPRCRMCARPAAWRTQLQQWSAYCTKGACTNRERLCQAPDCGKPFQIGVDGAGTKYCSTECKHVGYNAGKSGSGQFEARCAWCQKPRTWKGGRNPNAVWPYICNDCLKPVRHVVDRMKSHRVPHERARKLLDDPGCEVCGTDVLVKVKQRHHGQPSALLVVDHDHNCCPSGQHSCGECVRGLICSNCNIAAGNVRDSPKIARSLADYLETWNASR